MIQRDEQLRRDISVGREQAESLRRGKSASVCLCLLVCHVANLI